MINLEGAACATTDAELFFPEQGTSRKMVALAKTVCRECVDLAPCTEDAITNNTSVFGIQAGMNPQERREARKERIRG